ncbi:MAG TPA: hypothetical protein DEB39_08180 [Planctomycetaceae bacterium]|nr:hypothetical protein [Planctomycetaceae bacterium]
MSVFIAFPAYHQFHCRFRLMDAKPKPGNEVLFLVMIGILMLLGLAVVVFMPMKHSQDGGPLRGCGDRLKAVAFAMHKHHDLTMAFPAAYSVDKDGSILQGWRVAVLPFLDEPALYESIRRDEPWDSFHNSRYHGTNWMHFHCPDTHSSLQCCYSVVLGPDTPFTGPERWDFADITDGTSNTIMCVERRTPLDCWMDPTREVTQSDAEKGINVSPEGIGSPHPGGTQVMFCDGAVRFLRDSIDPALLKAMLTRGGGESLPLP